MKKKFFPLGLDKHYMVILYKMITIFFIIASYDLFQSIEYHGIAFWITFCIYISASYISSCNEEFLRKPK